MTILNTQISSYLEFCELQKRLDKKTLKAYKTDLGQFQFHTNQAHDPLNKKCIIQYVQGLHTAYKPKTVKRKIACLKAFLNHLEFEEQIDENPMAKIRLEFREPIVLPKSLSLDSIKKLLEVAHKRLEKQQSNYRHNIDLRNIAIIELLFATGLRVSELCSINANDIDLKNGSLKVWGKGARERIVYICNQDALSALRQYKSAFSNTIAKSQCFFVNRFENRLSEQSVRDMIASYAKMAKLAEHITPHMIRHSFATLMLEEDVDIRYIQGILGHSSISTTQIYTHISQHKLKNIMQKKHPRNRISV